MDWVIAIASAWEKVKRSQFCFHELTEKATLDMVGGVSIYRYNQKHS